MKKDKIVLILVIVAIIIVVMFLIIKSVSFKEDAKDTLVFSEISYEVPKEFELDNSITHNRLYSYSEDSLYCYLTISSYEKEYYDDFEEWFKERIVFNLNDKVSDLEQLNVNGNNILHINRVRNKENSKNSYYGLSSKNYYYFINYDITDYLNGDRENMDDNLCYNAIDEIISSIKLK
jgi:hypothetical protein